MAEDQMNLAGYVQMTLSLSMLSVVCFLAVESEESEESKNPEEVEEVERLPWIHFLVLVLDGGADKQGHFEVSIDLADPPLP
jgi:hypothetical protein